MTIIEILNKRYGSDEVKYTSIEDFLDKNPDLFIDLPIHLYNDEEFENLDCFDENSIKIVKRSEVSIEKWLCYLSKRNHYNEPDVFGDTKSFQCKYGLMDDEIKPHFIKKENLDVKIKHLHEELAEIEKAANENNLAEFADGLIDLIYVAAGAGMLCKLPMRSLWRDVQYCNMFGKKRVERLDDATKRKSTFDVKKTDKWCPPRGKEIIQIYTPRLREIKTN